MKMIYNDVDKFWCVKSYHGGVNNRIDSQVGRKRSSPYKLVTVLDNTNKYKRRLAASATDKMWLYSQASEASRSNAST